MIANESAANLSSTEGPVLELHIRLGSFPLSSLVGYADGIMKLRQRMRTVM